MANQTIYPISSLPGYQNVRGKKDLQQWLRRNKNLNQRYEPTQLTKIERQE
jgi:hypothetical protein